MTPSTGFRMVEWSMTDVGVFGELSPCLSLLTPLKERVENLRAAFGSNGETTRRTNRFVEMLNNSEQLSIRAHTEQLRPTEPKSEPDWRWFKGKKSVFLMEAARPALPPSQLRAAAVRMQWCPAAARGRCDPTDSRTGAARSARGAASKPKLEILFVFRCSEPLFQQRKWKRETKRAFFSLPSLWFLFVILYFYNKHKPLQRHTEKNKIWFFSLFFSL